MTKSKSGYGRCRCLLGLLFLGLFTFWGFSQRPCTYEKAVRFAVVRACERNHPMRHVAQSKCANVGRWLLWLWLWLLPWW